MIHLQSQGEQAHFPLFFSFLQTVILFILSPCLWLSPNSHKEISLKERGFVHFSSIRLSFIILHGKQQNKATIQSASQQAGHCPWFLLFKVSIPPAWRYKRASNWKRWEAKRINLRLYTPRTEKHSSPLARDNREVGSYSAELPEAGSSGSGVVCFCLWEKSRHISSFFLAKNPWNIYISELWTVWDKPCSIFLFSCTYLRRFLICVVKITI